MSRVNDAVSRILTQKFELGLFEHPFTDRNNIHSVGDEAHRAVAARAAAESQVLLKNAHHVLPLSSQDRIYLAGSNADNLGSQTGGWTLTSQGQAGAINDRGTTIRQAIQDQDTHVTYSADASAPTAGANVGVVVLGEHPNAGGQGDVGFTGGSTNGNVANLDLNAADHTAVDKMCHAMPCVVLVVSGRPMTIADQLSEIDGLVAPWLPGTEGEGVADALFGSVPFGGQLPQSWPSSLAQEPINLGDPNYNPLFPFGWGLRTTSTQADARSAVQAMRQAGRGASALQAAVRADGNWYGDGSVRRTAAVLAAVGRAAAALQGDPNASFAQEEAVVTVARDIAQTAMTGAGGPNADSSPPFAKADHELLTGEPKTAVDLLGRAMRQA